MPLPLKTTQERVSELRIQFPVSSGQQHRRTENEWVPVSPKKTETTTSVKSSEPSTSMQSTTSTSTPTVKETSVVVPGPQVFPPTSKPEVIL